MKPLHALLTLFAIASFVAFAGVETATVVLVVAAVGVLAFVAAAKVQGWRA